MKKQAETQYPVLDLIAGRWSPRAFAPDIPSEEDLASFFEAARWAPSCFNGQPWRFIVTKRDDTDDFGKGLSCLKEGNAQWARNAPVLAFLVVGENFEHNGKPNRWKDLDCGLAMGQLILQAGSMGWSTHIMAGFYPDKVREIFKVPDGFNPLAAFVIGRVGDPETLPDDLKAREIEPGERRILADTVFRDQWGKAMFQGIFAPANRR